MNPFMPLRVERISVEQFERMRAPWNALLSQSAADSVFLRWEWIKAWLDTFRPEREIFILTVKRDEELIGIAPFYVMGGALRSRYLRLCADEVEPDHLDLILKRGEEDHALSALRDFLRHNGSWQAVIFDHVGEETVLARRWAEFGPAFGGAGARREVFNNCPYVRIAGRFEEFVQSRRELRSYDLDKKLRKLTKSDVRIWEPRDGKEVEAAMGELFRLHAMRSDQKGVHSRFLSPRAMRFHRKVAALLFGEGILRLRLLAQGESAIAAAYCFSHGNRMTFFQTGMDPAWKKRSAGAILVNMAVREAFETGLQEFDFLKGEEPYKALWANAVRRDYRLSAYTPGARAALCQVKDRARFAIKLAARRINLPNSRVTSAPQSVPST